MTDGLTMNQLAERNAELVSEVEKLNQKLLAYEQAAPVLPKQPEPVAWTSKYGLEVRCKVVAFTDEESAKEYGDKNYWEEIIPLYSEAPAQPVIPEQQQPIAYIFKHPAGRLFWSLTDESNKWQADVIPVYAEPHELKIPPAIEPDYEVIKGILPTANPDEYACCIAADMWNACRAEMLKAQPVSEPYKLPSRVTAQDMRETFNYLMSEEEAQAAANGFNQCLLESNKPASNHGWIKGQFAYQDLFNAIGAAVVSKHPSIEISVKAFEDSMLAAAPAQESE